MDVSRPAVFDHQAFDDSKGQNLRDLSSAHEVAAIRNESVRAAALRFVSRVAILVQNPHLLQEGTSPMTSGPTPRISCRETTTTFRPAATVTVSWPCGGSWSHDNIMKTGAVWFQIWQGAANPKKVMGDRLSVSTNKGWHLDIDPTTGATTEGYRIGSANGGPELTYCVQIRIQSLTRDRPSAWISRAKRKRKLPDPIVIPSHAADNDAGPVSPPPTKRPRLEPPKPPPTPPIPAVNHNRIREALASQHRISDWLQGRAPPPPTPPPAPIPIHTSF